MNKFKQIISSKIFTFAAFGVAAGLLIFSSVGGTQAALTYYSENYASRVVMYDIGVSLVENGTIVSHRDYVSNSDYVWDQEHGNLLTNMLAEGEEVKLGVAYPEVLTVTNSGTINTYNRVNVYKYWVDKDGNKRTDLDPSFINLNLVNIGTSWVVDTESSTAERTVLYYTKCLESGETAPAFSDTITINGEIANKVIQTKGTRQENGKTYTTITTIYEYDDVSFVIEAEVNSIQEHNAEKAAWSVWGRNISISEDGTLSIN